MCTSEKVKNDPTEEILRMHYKYDHTTFNRLQVMATNGVLLKSLVDFTITVCAAYINGNKTNPPPPPSRPKLQDPSMNLNR